MIVSRTVMDIMNPMLTDIHCHILPGLDDGPQELSQSIQMVAGLKSLGFSKIVATPHIWESKWANTPEEIRKQVGKLQSEIDARGMGVTISPGAEHYLDSSFYHRTRTNGVLPMGDSPNLLIELPPSMISELDKVFFHIQTGGYSIVLAHPERYSWISFSTFRKLNDMGIRFQISLCSLGGKFGTAIRKRAEQLIAKGLIDVLATDVHSPADIGLWLEPGLLRSEKLLGHEMRNRYLSERPTELLRNY